MTNTTKISITLMAAAFACLAFKGKETCGMKHNDTNENKEAEWRRILSPEQYKVLRRKGTEPAFSGKYYDHQDKGVYKCAGCGQALLE